MFATPAMAQTAASGAGGAGGLQGTVLQFAPLILIFVLFYFMMIRPQQKRAKEHQAMLGAVKRGDTVVMSSGIIGKVSKVEDAEVTVEIAPTVNVKVIKSMISEVRTRGEPAPANDAKS
jgi:preprotein translocase subunit YajC